MNRGDILYASSLRGDGGYLHYTAGWNILVPQTDFYFQSFSARVEMQCYNGGFGAVGMTLVNRYGVNVALAVDSGADQDASNIIVTDIPEGEYHIVRSYNGGNLSYLWYEAHIYRSYNRSRVKGYKLGVIKSDFTGMEAKGVPITPALVNAGRVCVI